MPTPSSRTDTDSVSFNSTCPDEQAPHSQSGWPYLSPPSYEESGRPSHDTGAVIASGSGSGSVSGSVSAAVPGSGTSAGDNASSNAGVGSTSRPVVSDDQSPSSARLSPAMSPVVQLANDRLPAPEAEPMFLNNGEPDDTADKPSDTDDEMPDTGVTPSSSSLSAAAAATTAATTTATTATTANTNTNTNTTAAAANESQAGHSDNRADRADRADRAGRNELQQDSFRHTVALSGLTRPLRIDNREVSRYSIPEQEIWEPFGVNQALRRQLRAGSLGTSSRAPAAADLPSPSSMDSDKVEDHDMVEDAVWIDDAPEGQGCDPTSLRIIPMTPSTYLRPGSRFVGTQQSERQVYDVQVEIKHVDLRESFLCGYLRIQGLTEDHPTLTTYFEGEIIGTKYGFNTKHESWGANERVDMSHWGKFTAFRPFSKQAKKGHFVIKDHLQKDNLFMRWKEHFLVPDHRVRTIHGASFEGFYYICFNQVEGVVNGIYFHSKSEKFQQLDLKHVENRGCMSAVEFR